MKLQPVVIDTPFIKLESLLKFCGAVQTGGQAKWAIQNGEVLVNGEVCLMRGKKLKPGDKAQYNNTYYEVQAAC